ncbi:MAG: cbb3-type cytochrome c oxidase N-terminal domain-containing protein [Planctomycetota bacterium]
MEVPDQDRLLEHDYDGIKEYDNPLPGWWVYVFWASIFFSGIYVMYYQVGVGVGELAAYNAEAAAAFEKQAAEFASLEVTEELIAKLMADKPLMAGMEAKFVAKCATCHGAASQGITCPNLTDNYWLHGATLLSIFKTIRDGVPGKEMKSWKNDLGPGGLLAMAAYVGTRRNTNVAGGKAPQGTQVAE